MIKHILYIPKTCIIKQIRTIFIVEGHTKLSVGMTQNSKVGQNVFKPRKGQG